MRKAKKPTIKHCDDCHCGDALQAEAIEELRQTVHKTTTIAP